MHLVAVVVVVVAVVRFKSWASKGLFAKRLLALLLACWIGADSRAKERALCLHCAAVQKLSPSIYLSQARR